MDSEKPTENKATPNALKSNIRAKNPDACVSPSALAPNTDWWDKHKRWAELFGLLLLLVYTIYTVGMYYVNRDAANAAKSAAESAKHSLDLTVEQVHIGQRAYLILHNASLEGELKSGGAVASLELSNSGQTPAQDVSYYLNLTVLPSYPDSLPYPAQLTPASAIGAGQALKLRAKMLAKLSDDELKDITAEPVVLEGTKLTILNGRRLYLYGIVRYTTAFGAVGEAEYCGVYLKSRNVFMGCSTHNGMK